MNRTTPAGAAPTTSLPHGPSSIRTSAASLRSESASSEATSRHSGELFGAAYAATVNRPLAVTTQTALGTPPRSARPGPGRPRASGPEPSPDPAWPAPRPPGRRSRRYRTDRPARRHLPPNPLPRRRRRKRRRRVWRVVQKPSQTRMSAGGTVAAVATGSVGQTGLIERGHLDQFG